MALARQQTLVRTDEALLVLLGLPYPMYQVQMRSSVDVIMPSRTSLITSPTASGFDWIHVIVLHRSPFCIASLSHNSWVTSFVDRHGSCLFPSLPLSFSNNFYPSAKEVFQSGFSIISCIDDVLGELVCTVLWGVEIISVRIVR